MNRRFDRLGAVDQAILITLITSISMFLFPFSVSAQTSNQTPIVFEIKNLVKITIPTNYTDIAETDEQVVTEDNTQQINEQNAEILRGYLISKGSPLAEHADTLLRQDNWKLVVAISNGESTMCKHYKYNNCWGIGGAWNLRRYASLDEAIVDVNRLITTKYVADGLDTPQKMVRRYVGHQNASWVYANNKILSELNALPLQTIPNPVEISMN